MRRNFCERPECILKLYLFCFCALLLSSCNSTIDDTYDPGVNSGAGSANFSVTAAPISGATGGTDVAADAYLANGNEVTVSWTASVDATSYDVAIYESDGATIKCATTNVSAPNASYTFTGCALAESNIYKISLKAKNGTASAAAPNNLFSFQVDTTAPGDPASAFLYSSYTNNTHTSLTLTPDITISAGAGDGAGSGVESYQVRILNNGNSATVVDWTSASAAVGVPFRISSGVALTNATTYKVQVRAKDYAGNTSNAIDASTTFTTAQISSTPYDGLGLPDVTGLADGSLINTTLSYATYNRTNPYSANTLTISGTLDWNSASHSAIFLRTNNLALTNTAIIQANGADGFSSAGLAGAAGGKGGSGGGGGAGSNSAAANTNGGNGGAGGDGTAGTPFGGNTGGAGGVGGGSTYNAGFAYGTGGNGSIAGFNTFSGTAGSGINGAGGGGAGAYGAGWWNNGGAGGGAGGGLVVITTNSVSGTGFLKANGGSSPTNAALHFLSGAGGGGVLWMATKNYSGNLISEAAGGFGGSADGISASSGSSKIYQVNSDSSLVERRFIDTWTTNSVATVPTLPFPTAVLSDVTAAADHTFNNGDTLNGLTYSPTNPFLKKTVIVDGAVSYTSGTAAGIFIYANAVNFNAGSILDASGADGGAHNARDGGIGGEGGSGGGAGGGSGSDGNNGSGGNGGSGAFGLPGGGAGAGGGGIGGKGRIPYALSFNFGAGGNGGAASAAGGTGTAGTGGVGGNHFGGGGGGTVGGTWWGDGGSGGGGGGGIIAILANSISGTGTVRAQGGDGILAGHGAATSGAGGGGVIWIAAKSYDGNLTASVSGGTGGNNGTAGTARIYKWNSDNTLTLKNFTDSW